MAQNTTKPASDPLDGPDSEPVRVKHPKTGAHYTTTRALARMAGASLVKDHAAVDRYGQWLPPKLNNTKKES